MRAAVRGQMSLLAGWGAAPRGPGLCPVVCARLFETSPPPPTRLPRPTAAARQAVYLRELRHSLSETLMMRTVLILLCALGLVAGNPPTPQEKAFAGLRIAIREGKTDKAKGMLHESARQWGKTFTERKGIREFAPAACICSAHSR